MRTVRMRWARPARTVPPRPSARQPAKARGWTPRWLSSPPTCGRRQRGGDATRGSPDVSAEHRAAGMFGGVGSRFRAIVSCDGRTSAGSSPDLANGVASAHRFPARFCPLAATGTGGLTPTVRQQGERCGVARFPATLPAGAVQDPMERPPFAKQGERWASAHRFPQLPGGGRTDGLTPTVRRTRRTVRRQPTGFPQILPAGGEEPVG